ncbi:aspartate kinase [Anaerolineales bacterium]
MSLITMKFGGTSVGTAEAIQQVIDIIKNKLDEGHQVAVVVSAMSGVTNLLIESSEAALRGDRWGYMQLNTRIREKHEEVIHQLIADIRQREEILNDLSDLLAEHLRICDAVNILQEATPRILDAIVSFGERLSSRMIAITMRNQGVNALQYDSGQFLVTDSHFQSAEPQWPQCETRIGINLKKEIDQGITPIITGFLGATESGIVTTLGRGGSDYSAAIFAAYLNSDELIIWTDVDGVMTTDPRLDPRAQVLSYVSYQEVGELAYYGAKVLHPKTVQPIINRQIPLRVRNTFNTDHEGTLIGAEARLSNKVIKAVTAISRISMLTVSGKGMLGVPGIAGRAFLATANAGASILMISQSSSEQSFCYTVIDDTAHNVKRAVEDELRNEIAHQDVDGVDITDDVVIITVIGAGMRGTIGIAGRVFSTLGENQVNILAIAQGSSEVSISFVVAERDLRKDVICLHDLALESVNGH